jgi:predicted N-acyltransferase
MVKDITDAYAEGAGALSRFSYRPLETEPNMVLEI